MSGVEKDPRKLRGAIAGPGGAHDRNAFVIDATDAVLMDTVQVVIAEAPLNLWVLNLAGRINKSQDRAEIVYMFDTDGAAAIITELTGIAARQGPAVMAELNTRIDERLDKLKEEGHLDHRG